MKSEEILKKFRERLSSEEIKSKITFSEVIQYNITIGGKVEKTVTFDFKNFKIIDGAVASSDVEITIDDDLFVNLFKDGIKLANLHAEGKIQVKGNVELLAVLDSLRPSSQ